MPNDIMPNYVEAFTNAYQTGRQMALERGRQHALSMASTDPTAAQNELLRFGDFQGANAVGQIGAQQRALSTQQAVAPQIQQGEYRGAAQTAAAGGQYDVAANLAKLDDNQRARVKDVADTFATAAYGIAQIPLDQGPDPLASRKAALQKVAPHLLQLGVPQDEIAKADLSDGGLKQVAQSALNVKEQIDEGDKQKQIAESARHNTAQEGLAAAEQANTAAYRKAELSQGQQRIGIEAQNAVRASTQVLQDKDGTPYVYNAAAKSATTLDGQPYTPAGAQKLSSGNPRSAPAMAVQRYLQEHPDATAEDLTAFNANLRKEAAGATAFGTGKQGQTVNSLNVAVQHLDQLGQLADALGNGNVPLINKIGQAWTTQTGGAAPTNFNAAKQIVADEIVKAVVGSGGGVGDRDKAQQVVASANSPAQLKGVIRQYQGLMAGQLNGLRLQYKNSTGQDDFEQHLAPETRAQLEQHASGGSSGARPSLSAIFGH